MKLLIVLFFTVSLCSQHIVIIVPGTWATKELWHTPQGDFFKEVQKTAQELDMRVITYNWSGALSYDARVCAAQGLVTLIRSYPADTVFTVIAHSHGGNVVYEASQQLFNHGCRSRIQAVYTLATPCSELEVLPNMDVIEYVYHFFSFADVVQTIHGMYDRVLPMHARCCNLRFMINNREPDHGNMHHPMIGTWILYFHEYYIKNKVGSFANFIYENPGVISLFPFLEPRYQVDEDRENDLRRDRMFQYNLSTTAFDRSFDTSYYAKVPAVAKAMAGRQDDPIYHSKL
jgi:hypothetical protein